MDVVPGRVVPTRVDLTLTERNLLFTNDFKDESDLFMMSIGLSLKTDFQQL